MSLAPKDLKIVLLGNKNVGKTSIFNRYIYDEFGKTSMTIGAYFALKKTNIKNINYNLAVWDTAGEEKFDSLTNYYCRNSNGSCICYDITNYSTFQNLPRWIKKLQQEADKNCNIVIIGNKLDLVEQDPSLRKVKYEEAEEFAKSIDAVFFEVSSKAGTKVSDAFTEIVKGYMQKTIGQINTPKIASTIQLDRNIKSSSSDNKGCC